MTGARFATSARLIPDRTYFHSLRAARSSYAIPPYDRQGKLNGAEFAEMTPEDWQLIQPYLQANERHFGISIERDLLIVDGKARSPQAVYRKVRPVKTTALVKKVEESDE